MAPTRNESPRATTLANTAFALVEGEILPAAEARIPFEDRGLLFSESVYEVVVAAGGSAFAWQRHEERLLRSARGIGLDPGRFLPKVKSGLGKLLDKARGGVYLVYLHVTGGAAPRDHLPPGPGPEPLVYGTVRPFSKDALFAQRKSGVRVVTVADNRWALATYKTTQLLGSVLAKRVAHECGKDDAIFVDRSGHLLEGTSTNLFVVRGNKALTPPLSRNILPGITRALLLERAKDLVAEADLGLSDLWSSDEVFLASTTRPGLAIVEVDGRRIGSGAPGPFTAEVARRFDSWMEEEVGFLSA